MAKMKNNHANRQPAFTVPEKAESIRPAAAGAAGNGAGRPAPESAATDGDAETGRPVPAAGVATLSENGRVEIVHLAVRRVAIELPCAVTAEDRLGPRHLHAHLSQNARRALAALVRGLDVADECDRNKRRPKNTTPASVNFLLERLWEEIHGET